MLDLHFDSLLVESISLSLMHFLWQACVVASVAAIGFAALRRSPNSRYLWGLACFICLAICPVATFYFLQPIPSVAQQPNSSDVVDLSAMEMFLSRQSVLDSTDEAVVAAIPTSDRWEVGHGLVVAIWLLGQMFVGCRLLLSGYFIYRLKQIAVPVPEDLRKIALRLSSKMRIKCPLVATAERIGGAIAAGFFRQIIVIPTAWLTEMTPEMLEAVIAHELAHLRRHDLWINLAQRIVESVLFFHPVVWWLSKRIRQDREICCDLLAVEATKRRKHYAETLEHVARMESVRSELLVTHIGDDRMSLLKRVRLVLGQQPHPTSLGWWPAGVLAIVIPCCLVWLSQTSPSFAEQQADKPPVGPTAAANVVSAPDPVNGPVPAPALFTGRRVDRIAHLDKGGPPNENQKKSIWKLGEYVIEPPDIISIALGSPVKRKKYTWSKKQENEAVSAIIGNHLVGADGTVSLGVYGRVYISGMTKEKANKAVRDLLAKHFDKPEVTVDVAVLNSKFFYVFTEGGEIGDQVYRLPVTGNETVLDAISNLGGIGQLSNKKLCVKRPGANGDGEQVLHVDWDAITRGEGTATNYQMLPGDRLFISKIEEEGATPAVLGQPDLDGVSLPSPYYQYDDIAVYPRGEDFPDIAIPPSSLTFNPDFAPVAYQVAFDRFASPTTADRTKKQQDGELPWRDQKFRHRIPLMGAMTSGGKAKVTEPPTTEQVLQLIRVGLPNSAWLLPENLPHLKIKKHLLADYVDPPRFFPLIGPAQLHHAHYQYDVELVKGKKKRDAKSVPLTFFIDHQHLHASEEVEVPHAVKVSEPPPKSDTAELYVETYHVGDLVVPIGNPRFSKTGGQERIEDAKPDFDSLTNLLSSTVAPNSWNTIGGIGAMEPFEGNLSLVVNQTQDVHEEIKTLFAQLRRLQESKVTLRATNLKLTSSLTEKLGLHGKLLAVLTAKEREQVLSAARRDARARTYADLKANLFNGQFMSMAIDDGETLDIQVVAEGNKAIRVFAGVKETAAEAQTAQVTRNQAPAFRMMAENASRVPAAASPSKTIEQTTSAQLTQDQALLVRMQSDSKDDEEPVFRLITSELTKTNEETRTGTSN